MLVGSYRDIFGGGVPRKMINDQLKFNVMPHSDKFSDIVQMFFVGNHTRLSSCLVVYHVSGSFPFQTF